jgi:hypothetical protein
MAVQTRTGCVEKAERLSIVVAHDKAGGSAQAGRRDSLTF